MSNKRNNTRRPDAAARPDARRPAPSKGERRREAQHRRAIEALKALAPYAERAAARTLEFWASEQGERAAQRFEAMLERAVSSAPAQRGLSALLAYAERGLEASASEAEARSKRGLAEEDVALERVVAEGRRAEELAQLRHRSAVAELEAQARAAEARLAEPAEPAPEPAPAALGRLARRKEALRERRAERGLVSEGLDPALVEALKLNASLHQQHAELERLNEQLRAQAEEEEAPPPMPEPQAQAEAELAKLRDRLKEISISAGHALAQGAPAEARLRALRAEVAHLWRTSH